MNFRTLDLNLLKVFDVLMVERNVTRAAGRLAMTQPAVSNALRRLRESTREDLFVSTPTGMIPTPSAEAGADRSRTTNRHHRRASPFAQEVSEEIHTGETGRGIPAMRHVRRGPRSSPHAAS